ncbi:MAG: RtcB family protein, partial [Acidiferrobacteraceae bacterium]
AVWALENGWGRTEDLERIEERGCMTGADPRAVSAHAKKRQHREMGTLGSGNHYLEVQHVTDVYDPDTAARFGLRGGDVVLSIHCGSRGLGHQIGTEFLKRMVTEAPRYGLSLPDRELACAPLESPLGEEYLGAMRAGINCALANRQIVTHLAREAFARILPQADLRLLYDVSHNTCKEEEHTVDGRPRRLFVHRKGATRALGPGHPTLPDGGPRPGNGMAASSWTSLPRAGLSFAARACAASPRRPQGPTRMSPRWWMPATPPALPGRLPDSSPWYASRAEPCTNLHWHQWLEL